MWSFWQKRTQKAQLRAAFGEFLSEQSLQELGSPSHKFPFPSLQKEAIGYVILQVCGDTSEQLQPNLARALDAVGDNDGHIEAIMSSIFVVAFKNTPDSHRQLIDTFRDGLGSEVRAVYGHGEYSRGSYGSQRRFTYGTFFPDISTKLEALLKLEFGTWKEV